ncbi:coiled-coil domain-containing protein 63 [Nematostella vectensis]|uniref:coiled-coil domain-containing protein 63 n=1 Tax=Nematostella vectensis TaxID=45351 RepID=UPI0020772325|nr:coiled-coil domain-containing protein 63 [Nematostella vectensis]
MIIMRDDEKVDPAEALLEAQQELATLQRQYICLRKDKKSYTEDCENVIRRQEDTIQALQAERTELLTFYRVAGRKYNECFDLNNLQDINELMDREDQLKVDIARERMRVGEVEKQVCAMEAQINDQRKRMRGSKDVAHHKYILLQKQIRVMQNRLDNLSKKFNHAMTNNRQLRDNIEHVLGQKARYRFLDNKLQQKLNEGKAEIQRISEIAMSHLTARDEAQHRMASLRERSERDETMYSLKIKDVLRVIDHDNKLREFMSTKAEDRASLLIEEIKTRELRRISNQLGGLKDQVSEYERIFGRIKAAAGIYDTDTLVESFIENEDKNFALYNYVNAMGREMENLNSDIKYLREEIELTKKEEHDYRRNEILREMEGKLDAVRSRTASLNSTCKKERRILEQVKPRIEKLFNAIKCDRNIITEMLGGGATVTDYNMMLYLGIMEHKCNELLQVTTLLKVKSASDEQKEALWEALFGLTPLPAHGNLSINAPRIEDEADHLMQVVRYSEVKPLTTEEVQHLIAAGGVVRPTGVTAAMKARPAKR